MTILYIFLSLLAGVLQSLQAAINSLLGKQVGNPIFSAFLSSLLGGAVLGLYLLFTCTVLPKGWAAAGRLFRASTRTSFLAAEKGTSRTCGS